MIEQLLNNQHGIAKTVEMIFFIDCLGIGNLDELFAGEGGDESE
jgi:hypothetical protein